MKLIPVPFSLKPVEKSTEIRPCTLSQILYFDVPSMIERITFRNYYCCFITIQYCEMESSEWITLVSRLRLMKDAHYEDDAQNWHSIEVGQYVKDKSFLMSAVKISYLQPSPNWTSCCIKNMSFLKATPDYPPSLQVKLSTAESKNEKAIEGDRGGNKELWSRLFTSIHSIHGYQRAYESHTTLSEGTTQGVQDIYSLSYEHERDNPIQSPLQYNHNQQR